MKKISLLYGILNHLIMVDITAAHQNVHKRKERGQ